MKIFVEVGCCYYDTLHHLLDDGWRGFMIDPVVDYLDRLPNHDNLVKINAAITSHQLHKTPSLELTYVAEQHYSRFDEQAKRDFHGMGSTQPFRTKILTGHVGNYNEGDIKTKVVPAMSLNWIIDYYNISKIDLLKIDAEGADFDILSSIDLSKTEVSEIWIEHKHYDDIFLGKYLELNNYKWEFSPTDWSTIIAKKL